MLSILLANVMLLLLKVFNAEELHILKSLMTANSVRKQCFVVLHVKLQVKIRFKTFYLLLEVLYSHLALNSTTDTA